MKNQRETEMKIDKLELKSNIILSPLASVTDKAFRQICNEYPLGYSYTEMVSAKGLLYKDKKTEEIMSTFEGEDNLGIQIFGSDPDIIGKVIKEDLNFRQEFKTIDLNMGCPAPKIVKNGEGSALMKEPELVKKIIYEMKENSNKPITVKFRLGFDEESINYLEIGKIAEKYGASAVTLHGRTRKQMYSGKANWEAIKILKEELSIPVIGNGDIFTPEDAIKMLDDTRCDGVAVARGAMGNPFIFKQIDDFVKYASYRKPTIYEILDVIDRHYRYLIAYKGDRIAVNEMRKHIGWYLKGYPDSNKLRDEINKTSDIEQIFMMLKDYRDYMEIVYEERS